MSEDNRTMLDLARHHFARCAWSHKVHEKQRELLNPLGVIAKWAPVISAGATVAVTAFSAVCQEKWMIILASLFAACTLAANIWDVSFSPLKEELCHRSIAKSLLALRGRWELLILRIIDARDSSDDLRRELMDLVRETSSVYAFAPDTSQEAYKKASEAIKQSEEFTFSEEEINKLLPESLRKPM